MSGSPPPNFSPQTRRFLVDENLPRSLVPELVAAGHAAEHVRDIEMGGAKDPAVYGYAQTHTQTIITGDKDFSNLRAYPPPHAGIVVAGIVVVEVPDTMPPVVRNRLILRQLATLAGQSLADTLIIVEAGRLRVRR